MHKSPVLRSRLLLGKPIFLGSFARTQRLLSTRIENCIHWSLRSKTAQTTFDASASGTLTPIQALTTSGYMALQLPTTSHFISGRGRAGPDFQSQVDYPPRSRESVREDGAPAPSGPEPRPPFPGCRRQLQPCRVRISDWPTTCRGPPLSRGLLMFCVPGI